MEGEQAILFAAPAHYGPPQIPHSVMPGENEPYEPKDINDNSVPPPKKKFKSGKEGEEIVLDVMTPSILYPGSSDPIHNQVVLSNVSNIGDNMMGSDGDSESKKNKNRNKAKKYPCTGFGDCNFSGSSPGALTIHQRIHTGDRPFKCDVPGCSFSATTNGHLKIHRRSHSENPVDKFLCDEPGCIFKAHQLGDLKRHKRRHTKEKPYPCDNPDCKYTAARLDTLNQHKKTHSGVRPYVCDFADCNYTATQAGNLKKHQKTHGMEKKVKRNTTITSMPAVHRKLDGSLHTPYSIDTHFTDNGLVPSLPDEHTSHSLLASVSPSRIPAISKGPTAETTLV